MDLRMSAKKYLPVPVADVLKAAKYNIERWIFPKHVVAHQYGPYHFFMNIHDRVAKEWYDKDWELPPEIKFLSHFGLDRGALVFDLGAHQCLIAMMLAKTVGSHGKVIAVEASAHNVEIARRNLELNHISNVSLVHGLISSFAGKEFAAPSFNSSRTELNRASSGSSLVDALTIDALAKQHGVPDVIYLDIEGFEIEALKGASRTLSSPCTWFIELHGDEMLARYHANNHDVLQFFPEETYETYVGAAHDDDRFHPLVDRRWLPRERCYLVFVPSTATSNS